MKLFTFEIAGGLFALETRFVYRVIEDVPVTPVCFTPPAYMGLIYYRGELFDVVDPACLLKRSGTDPFDKSRFIVVRWSDRKMVLAVRRIEGLLWIENGSKSEALRTEDGKAVEMLEPDRIWNTLERLPYGPVQV